jgi:hypothetical protein
MSFMRNLFGGVRSVGESAKVGKAYSFVANHFHLKVSSQMMTRTQSMLATMADTASVPELAIWYLSEYGRSVARSGLPEEKEAAQNQFNAFIAKLRKLQDAGEPFGDYSLMFFCGAAAMLGADASAIKRSEA